MSADLPDPSQGAGAAAGWPALPSPDMLDRIIAIIAKEAVLDPSLIKPESTLETLGLVSIDVVNILMGVEEEFDTYVPMSAELQDVRTLADLLRVVAAEMERNASGAGPA